MNMQYRNKLLGKYGDVPPEELSRLIEQHTAEQQPSSVKEYIKTMKNLQKLKSLANVQGGL